MTRFFKYGLFFFFISMVMVCCQSQNKASRTSSARAAYGNAEPFKAHVKKNNKAKKKGLKEAKKKSRRESKEPYRRLPM